MDIRKLTESATEILAEDLTLAARSVIGIIAREGGETTARTIGRKAQTTKTKLRPQDISSALRDAQSYGYVEVDEKVDRDTVVRLTKSGRKFAKKKLGMTIRESRETLNETYHHLVDELIDILYKHGGELDEFELERELGRSLSANPMRSAIYDAEDFGDIEIEERPGMQPNIYRLGRRGKKRAKERESIRRSSPRLR